MSDSSTLASRTAETSPTRHDPEKPAAAHNVTGLEVQEELVHEINAEKKEQAAAVEAGVETDVVYPSGLKLVFITIALCLAVLCLALDNSWSPLSLLHLENPNYGARTC